MTQELAQLFTSLKANTINFKHVIEFIEARYQHINTAFKNGDAYNQATQNQGSAKVFAFANLHQLSAPNTLYLFAEHYQAVLSSPTATDHQNIRQFMLCGWEGIAFEGEVLVEKV